MTHHLQLAGVAFAALSLLWPLFFFPLVWGAVTLLLDPWVHRRDPSRSLLGALEEGRPAVILQLLAGGLAIGFLWELYNVAARGKWIYTVPGLEELKLFEMPVLGFLGFPVLALDAWAMWQALELTGLAPTSGRAPRAERKPSRHAVTLAATLAVLASGAVLLGMQRFTITSTTPVLEELVGEAAGAMQLAGHDVFSLAESEPEPLAAALGVAPSTARRWIERAELVVLRGIGVDNARHLAGAEIATVGDLARADAAALARRLGAVSHSDRARVRLWVRAAQEATERPPPPPPEP